MSQVDGDDRPLTPAQREATDRFLAAWVTGVRDIFLRHRQPGDRQPCASCAMHQETDDWPGWDSTAYGLLRALGWGGLHPMEIFACHQTIHGDDGAKTYIPRLTRRPVGTGVGAASWDGREVNVVTCAGFDIVAQYPAEVAQAFNAALAAYDAPGPAP